jgi:hypothetical protein
MRYPYFIESGSVMRLLRILVFPTHLRYAHEELSVHSQPGVCVALVAKKQGAVLLGWLRVSKIRELGLLKGYLYYVV